MTTPNDNAERSASCSGSGSSHIGEDLRSLAFSLGFAWPDEGDEEGRWRVLKLMAGMASHWRSEVEKCRSEAWESVHREQLYQHLRRRNIAMAAKVRNLRAALRDYIAGQSAWVREKRAEIAAFMARDKG